MKTFTSKQKIFAAALILGTIGVGALSVGTTYASEKSGAHPMSKLIEAIATKFNVSIDDVEAVFKEHRLEKQANRKEFRQQIGADILSEKVADGTITQAQADLITAKREELRTQFESNKALSKDAKKAAIEAKIAELKSWAATNNIPEDLILPPMNGHRGNR